MILEREFWHLQLYAILSFARMPLRCPLTFENDLFDEDRTAILNLRIDKGLSHKVKNRLSRVLPKHQANKW
jgi:hypothetical protein